MEKLITLKVNTSRYYAPFGYICQASWSGWINSIGDGGKIFTGMEWTNNYEVLGTKRGDLDKERILPFSGCKLA